MAAEKEVTPKEASFTFLEKAPFTFLEIDEISVLEEEFTRRGRPYPAYLMRKVLRHIEPNWEEAHPQYKHI